MKATIFFNEILDYVEKHYSVRPQVQYVDDKTLELGVKIGSFLSLKLRVRVEVIRKTFIALSYESLVPKMIISKALGYVEAKIPAWVEIKTEENHVYVYLDRIDALKKTLQTVYLQDITVKPDGLEVEVGLN